MHGIDPDLDIAIAALIGMLIGAILCLGLLIVFALPDIEAPSAVLPGNPTQTQPPNDTTPQG